LIYIALRLIFKSRILWFKITAFFIVLMMIGGVYFYLHKQVVDFYTFKDPPYNELPKFTEAGNKYKHDSTNIYRENGYRVGYYLCVKEMKSEWNKISEIQYDSIINGYPLRATLIRYLTSKGLPKDSVGVSKLTKRDIENINKGITNYKFANTLKLSNRIYKVIWQIYVYSKTKNANNQSVTQRYEFYKTAMHIIYNNVWLGVGVGDVKDAYEKAIQALKDAGHTIVEKEMMDAKFDISAYYITATAEATTNLARYDGIRYGNRVTGKNLEDTYIQTRSNGFGDEVKRRILLGNFVLSSGYYEA
jgi:hypothetical protein